jgi:RNA polymerase sigma-70 factor (ECF subfamily)
MTDDTDLTRLAARLAVDVDGAFPDLVRRLQDGVYSGALRMTGSPTDAEDVAQEAFLRAYRALGDYPAERVRSLRLQAWVWTIAANLCRNRARARSRRPEEPLQARTPADPDPTPEQAAVAGDERDRLAGHVAALAWPQRAAVVLRHVVGMGYGEIARALDRPEGTVKSDVHRALARLRTVLMTEEAR